MQNLRELPKLRDSLSYLYLERTRIEKKANGITFQHPEGEVGIPIANLATLMLGPGTTITHAAVKELATHGCTITWTGEDAVRFYASGTGETRSSKNLFRQAEAWADAEQHLRIVRRLYEVRFPEPLKPSLSIEQIRGLEGVRVRESYARASRETGVAWKGRSYKRDSWADADPINRALSAASACLYGVCHAAIVSLGFSPGLGFIHIGKQLSFVYDIADLYKATTVIPAAFKAVAEAPEGVERRVRKLLRHLFGQEKLLLRISRDLDRLFSEECPDHEADPYESDSALPGSLWSPNGSAPGGIQHARDDPQENTEEPAR